MSHGGGDEGGERWLVSYADFITLLMVLFVVLYSMGQVDVEKYKMLAENLRSAFSGGGPVKVVDSQISTGGGTTKDGEPNPIVVPGIPEKPPVSEEVAGRSIQYAGCIQSWVRGQCPNKYRWSADISQREVTFSAGISLPARFCLPGFGHDHRNVKSH